MMESRFRRLALIGVGLIGSSIARAARAQKLVGSIVATARSAKTRRRVMELGIADQVVDTNAAAVEGADLVIVCVPVGQCGTAAREIGPHLAPGAIVSDVGSVKVGVVRDMAPHLPQMYSCRASVAGTEHSGRMRALRNSCRPLVHSRRRNAPMRSRSSVCRSERARRQVATRRPSARPRSRHHEPRAHLIAYVVGTADDLSAVTRSGVLHARPAASRLHLHRV
jgi:cyclohexadieny/prephenate dehydrogenase